MVIRVSSYLAENDFQVDKKSFSKSTRFSFGSDQFEDKIYHTNIGNAKKFAHKGLIKSENILKKN